MPPHVSDFINNIVFPLKNLSALYDGKKNSKVSFDIETEARLITLDGFQCCKLSRLVSSLSRINAKKPTSSRAMKSKSS